MAAVTLLGSQFDTNNGLKAVIATPALGDLIVIISGHTGNTSNALPDDDAGGTYANVATALKATSADRLKIFVRSGLIDSAVSTQFTHDPGTTTGGGIVVLAVSGMGQAGSGAVRQAAVQSNQSAATPSPVLGMAAAGGDAMIGVVFNATNPATMTARASWAERADIGYASPTAGLEVMSIDSGETASSIAWGSASASAFASAVIELVGATALTAGLMTNAQTFYGPSIGIELGAPTFELVNKFYVATLSSNLDPPLFTNVNSFFGAVAGDPPLQPPTLTSAETFYPPSIGFELLAGLLVNTQVFNGAGAANTKTPPLVITPDTEPVAITPIYSDDDGAFDEDAFEPDAFDTGITAVGLTPDAALPVLVIT